MSLVQQRERRANAGSRMRALLDKEIDMEELFELDESEDEAFSGIDEEQVDTVDSDFDMEESEGEAEQEQLAEQEEKLIRQAERQAKRPIRQQQYLQKPASSTTPKPGRPNKKTHHDKQQQQQQQQSSDVTSRQSMRTKTILNRMQVEEQMRESESKKARIPKRTRPEIRQLTQEELLAEAAITEQENLASLEQWQQKEAERQAKAKTKVKRGIQGPFIRYHSFTDGATNERPQPRKLVMILDDSQGNTTQVNITDPAVLAFHYRRDIEECDVSEKTQITFFPGDPTNIHNTTTITNGDSNIAMEEGELETNNTLQHVKTEGLSDRELDRLDRIPPLASWADRSARPIKPLPCPITGKESRYREPMTHTPYADATSYRNIKNCLNHQYIWSPSLGIYVGNESDSKGAEGVPDGWERMLEGKRPEQDDWISPFPSWMTSDDKALSLSQTERQQNDTKPTRKRQRHRT